MRLPVLLLAVLTAGQLRAQTDTNDEFKPVFGFCIAAPRPSGHQKFIDFIDKELGPKGINTLILRVDYNYQFESHPELRDPDALSKDQAKEIVKVARKYNIELIPQINLLGHQSWSNKVSNLLRVYPQFDETPHVKMPEEYKWPNEDSLYCKSYCPLHPEVHAIVFALVDEIMEAFEAKSFHAGMDEVFYIGDDQCPRCAGKSKAKLFADDVTKIRNHLNRNDQTLWIWGDRLIDGKSTGIGMWEASTNNTHTAIDMIPKDVVICDWHYERADATPVLFASKGLSVISCFWNREEVTNTHIEMMNFLQSNSSKAMQPRFLGVMQTIWSPATIFIDSYYGESDNERGLSQVASFKAMLNYKQH